MRSNAPKLGDAARGLVELLARRSVGLTIPDLMVRAEVGRDVARRFVRRGLREGWLRLSGETRRRVEVFGEDWPGRPAVVYRAPRPGGSAYARERRLDPARAWLRWRRRHRTSP